MVVHDLADGQLTLRAMSLVYTTLLSLVPLLAVSFSVLKAFGVHNQVEPLLLNVLAPMGEKGAEVASRILGFVENIKVGFLGGIGLVLLFYTVMSLIQKIERAFNYVWRVNRPRTLLEGFSNYFSVLFIGPVLIFSALAVTATVMNASIVQQIAAIEPFGSALRVATKMVPYLLVIAAFTFVYIFMPNTRVRFSAALIGAVVAAMLWQSMGWAFASFVASSTKYTAIYSSFAILFFFMLWLYVAWLILLVGASVAFYLQHPEYLGTMNRDIRLSGRLQERSALLVMFLIARHYYEGKAAWSVEALARRLGLPSAPLGEIVLALEARGLLLKTGEDTPAYVPARDLEHVRLRDVLAAVRSAGEGADLNPRGLVSEPAIEALVEELAGAVDDRLRERTLRDLVATPALPGVSGGGEADMAPAPVPIAGQRREEGGPP